MIEQKTTDGRYVIRDENTGQIIVQTKEELETQRDYLLGLEPPSDAELIEVGKLHHLYYQREQHISECRARLDEIELFENH